MVIFIESSNADVYRDGAWVMIAKTNTKLCPVRNVRVNRLVSIIPRGLSFL